MVQLVHRPSAAFAHRSTRTVVFPASTSHPPAQHSSAPQQHPRGRSGPRDADADREPDAHARAGAKRGLRILRGGRARARPRCGRRAGDGDGGDARRALDAARRAGRARLPGDDGSGFAVGDIDPAAVEEGGLVGLQRELPVAGRRPGRVDGEGHVAVAREAGDAVHFAGACRVSGGGGV